MRRATCQLCVFNGGFLTDTGFDVGLSVGLLTEKIELHAKSKVTRFFTKDTYDCVGISVSIIEGLMVGLSVGATVGSSVSLINK